METETIFVIVYILAIILIVEYIYHYRYIPNMRRLAANNYQDL
jgi:hypothetical protein